MYLRSLSFKSKALMVLGGLQLLGLLLLGTVAYNQSQEALEQLAHDKLKLGMEVVSKDLADYIRDESRMAMMLSSMLPIQSVLEARLAGIADDQSRTDYDMLTDNLAQIFTSAATLHQECLELTLLDWRGMEVMRVTSLGDGKPQPVATSSLRSRSSAHYFSEPRALAPGQVYVSPLIREAGWPASEGTKEIPLTIWLASPVFTTAGEISGVFAMRLNPDEMLQRIHSPLAEGRAFLVDDRGTVVYQSVPGSMAMPIAPELAGLHPRLAEILARNDAHDVYINCELEAMAAPEGADPLDHHVGLCMHGYGKVHYDPLDSDNYWTVVFDAPPQVIFAPTRALRDRFIGWGSLVIGVSLVFTYLLSNRLVVKPVLHLGEAAQQVADGDLHPAIKPYDRNDEIGRLYNSFGVMLDRLRTATENLQDEIRLRTRELERSEARLEQQNEELERLNSYKSHLLSVVSHELKTPLASLDGFGRIINQIILTGPFLEQLEPDQRDKLSQVRQRVDIMGKNTGRLIRLVNELLDFSRIDRGRGLELLLIRSALSALLYLSALACSGDNILTEQPPDCRVGGGAPQRWPPSAAQTGHTVFPYPAFTKVRLASRLDGRNQEDKTHKAHLGVELTFRELLPTPTSPAFESMRPDASQNPAVETREKLTDVGFVVIEPPSSNDRIDLVDQLLRSYRSLPTGPSPYLILEVLGRLLPGISIQVSFADTRTDLT